MTWEYLHPFVEDDRYSQVGDDGACPYFWPIGDKHILIYFSHMRGARYLLGDYDKQRDKFRVTYAGEFNFGSFAPAGIHAPSATPDGEGGVIVIFNMNAHLFNPNKEWPELMSLPRRLTLAPDGELDELRIEPAGDVESLRSEKQSVGAMTLPANQEVVLEKVRGNAMEMAATIDPADASMIELNVLRSANAEEVTRIIFYRNRGFRHLEFGGFSTPQAKLWSSVISIDNSRSSELPGALSRPAESAQFYLAPDEPLKLRVFIDRSVVEVFANGKQCVAVRVFPGRKDSVGVSLRAQGKDARLRSLEAWQMEDIYQ
jgi:beta-fructofuranosidase